MHIMKRPSFEDLQDKVHTPPISFAKRLLPIERQHVQGAYAEICLRRHDILQDYLVSEVPANVS
jgi:hypothetical protein